MIGVLFYVLMIRPERRKRAELSQMLANLKKNDRVVTIGGIFGTVVNVQQGLEEVTIKVDEGSNTKIADAAQCDCACGDSECHRRQKGLGVE